MDKSNIDGQNEPSDVEQASCLVAGCPRYGSFKLFNLSTCINPKSKIQNLKFPLSISSFNTLLQLVWHKAL